MEKDKTLETLVESIFSNNYPPQKNDIWPTSADWAVINKTIYSELKLRVNSTVFYTFPYLGRSIINAISKKLLQKASEFESKGGNRNIGSVQIKQLVDPIVDSIIDFAQNLGKGLHSPQM